MIDRELAGFIEEGVAIHMGTRDADLVPEGARAVAAKVEQDGRHLVVYISAVAAARLVPNLEANGRVAIVFGRPTDDRACQVKGTFVEARTATSAEEAFVEAQWNAFLDNLERIGFPRRAAAGWVTWPALAIRVQATALFEQTPGPQAGTPLA